MKLSGRSLKNIDKTVVDKLIPIAKRLALKDYEIWGENSEASSRLNWVDLPQTSRELLPTLDSLSAWARSNNLNKVVLCGMGGSSLAAEVIAAVYKKKLIVIDSTHPAQIFDATPEDLKQCVIIIGSKSGTTIETISHLKYFTNLLIKSGLNPADHLVIITDSQSSLDISSKEQGLRVINADSQVGGRFSALSAFGLVPAALLGIDISVLLDDAESAAKTFTTETSHAVTLASLIFTETSQILNLSDNGSNLPGLSDWIEQLIAESTGKDQRGRLPVIMENSDGVKSDLIIGFSQGNFSLIVEGSLGEQFILWEWVTALLCYLLKVDPFNQPNVTEAKTRTTAILSSIVVKDFVMPTPVFENDNYAIFSNQKLFDIAQFVALSTGYIALMAYLPQNAHGNILRFKDKIASITSSPITFGWGPRFLHSTGQIHKGGQPNGIFIQITNENDIDIEIPGEAYSFGQLILAQALGDADALTNKKLPYLRVHLKDKKFELENLVKKL